VKESFLSIKGGLLSIPSIESPDYKGTRNERGTAT
jgi:hypothetical protein